MQTPEEKIKAFDELMKGEFVLMHVDSRKPGVTVPENLLNNPALVLKLSYQFQGKIERNDSGIEAYLLFNNKYELCILPWTSVWGISPSHGQQILWPEDIPKEVLVQLAKNQLGLMMKKLFFGKKIKERRPDETQFPEAATTSEKTEPSETDPKKNKGQHLRLIK
ncbi:hypothetical protein JNK13_07975 [bacterium]|nr:hypothetical protein [bacterium]